MSKKNIFDNTPAPPSKNEKTQPPFKISENLFLNRFLIRNYLRIGTNSVSQLSVSEWFSDSVSQCVYKVEVSRLQFTIGLGVGWTRWEWTVHVNTLYTLYTLNTMYTLYRGSHMYRCTELHICTEYVEVLKQALNAIAAFGAIFILNFIKTIPPPTHFQLVQTLLRIVSPHNIWLTFSK